MLMYLNYLGKKYLGQKGQGLVEYAVVVAVVVALGTALLASDTGIKAKIVSLYESVFTSASKIQ